MKNYQNMTAVELSQIVGGGGGLIPTLPTYNQLLRSFCGLADGWNGKRRRGHC